MNRNLAPEIDEALRGRWEPVGDPVLGRRRGRLKLRLYGHKLRGGWTLVRVQGKQERERRRRQDANPDHRERPAP